MEVTGISASERGHWTKEPPTEPGWYRVKLKDLKVYEMRRISTDKDGYSGVDVFEPKTGFWKNWIRLDVYPYAHHWWSHPETLPPLPEEG